MSHKQIIKQLNKLASSTNAEGMARFGIRPKTRVLGISVTELRKIAKKTGRDHTLSSKLWKENVHETRIFALLVEEVEKVTEKQMDTMIKKFDSWDICDLACGNVFDRTPFGFKKAIEWSKKDREFEKRAGYALMACLAWHNKQAPDSKFTKFLPHIKRGATDERNFVRKAVNWALRQVGKRNKFLNKKAIKLAREIEKLESKSAKWIAKDALRELTSKSTQNRLN